MMHPVLLDTPELFSPATAETPPYGAATLIEFQAASGIGKTTTLQISVNSAIRGADKKIFIFTSEDRLHQYKMECLFCSRLVSLVFVLKTRYGEI